MPQPKVSIIIPVYNTGLYIRDCLDSISSQDMEDFEVICIDDGSLDGSGTVCDEYACKDSRFHVIHTVNEGTFIARKTGIARSTGEFILFVDSDDRLASSHALKTVTALMEENRTDILQFSVETFGKERAKAAAVKRLVSSVEQKIEGTDRIIDHLIKRTYTWHLWNKAFKGNLCRKAIERTEDSRLCTGTDAYLFLAIASFSETYLSRETVPVYAYRVGQGMTTRTTVTLPDFRNYTDEIEIVGLVRRFFMKTGRLFSCQKLLLFLQERFLYNCFERFIQLPVSERKQGYSMLLKAFGNDVVEKKELDTLTYWRYRFLAGVCFGEKKNHYRYKCLLSEALKTCQIENSKGSCSSPDRVLRVE